MKSDASPSGPGTPPARNLPGRMSERRTSLLAALLVAFGPVSMALYTPAMPQLVAVFDTSAAAINATLTIYFAGFAVSQLLAGPVSDAFGRRKATIGFLLVYLAGGTLAALAETVEVLLVARLVQGVGAAVGVTVARAIVRDQFTGDRASRIMNTVAIMLAVAPAMSPAIGGFLLSVSGWHAIFVAMVIFGVAACCIVAVAMRETTVPNPALVSAAGVTKAYRTVIANAEFLSASLVSGFAVGALYAQATILPFVMIGTVGLTPAEFGLAMLMQSGFFFIGSIVMRVAMRQRSAASLAPFGLGFIATGGVLLLVGLGVFGPHFLTIMGPIAFSAFGIAFVMPHMQIAALMPFPTIAGSASAMMGFIQMSAGLVGGSVAAVIGNPVAGIAVVVPAMGLVAVLSYVWHRRVIASTGHPAADETGPAS